MTIITLLVTQSMPKTKAFILFITGISRTGKTYLYEKLRKNPKYKDISFHDIDEEGVPEVGRTHWRAYRVEALLHNAIKKYKTGKSSILCGISKPAEVLDFKYFTPLLNVHFLLLDIPITTFRKRLRESLKDSTEDINLTELELVTKTLKHRLSNQVLHLRNGHLIDTKRLNKQQMVKGAEGLIDGLM